jgi:chromosome segregation ATPase
LEAEVTRRAQELEGLQAELCQAGESLVREVESRRVLEEELERTKQALQETQTAFDERLSEQAQELSSTAERLSSATTFRHKIEDDLKRVRTELEAQVARRTDELEKLRQELAWEKARNRELIEEQRNAAEAAQAKLRELASAERKAEERRQAAEAEGRRAAEDFNRARSEWEQQQRDLVAEVAALRKRIEAGDVDLNRGERNAVGNRARRRTGGVDRAREEFARRMGVHTEELLRLDGALHEALAARQRVDQQLVQSQEELARKAADYAAAVLKGRRGVGGRSGPGPAAGDRLREELESARGRLQAETGKRQTAEAELERERARVQERMRRFAAALEPVAEDWLPAR